MAALAVLAMPLLAVSHAKKETARSLEPSLEKTHHRQNAHALVQSIPLAKPTVKANTLNNRKRNCHLALFNSHLAER